MTLEYCFKSFDISEVFEDLHKDYEKTLKKILKVAGVVNLKLVFTN